MLLDPKAFGTVVVVLVAPVVVSVVLQLVVVALDRTPPDLADQVGKWSLVDVPTKRILVLMNVPTLFSIHIAKILFNP